MIATERFIYLHLHKTGGTFLNECLMKFFPGAHQLGYHLPRRMIPPKYRQLPILGFVRNPWDYYVSWYSFQSARQAPNALFECASRRGELDFKDTVTNLLNLGVESSTLDALLPMLPENYINHGFNVPRSELEPIRSSGIGFFSYLYRYMYLGVGAPLHIGRAEELRSEFLDFLDGIGVHAGAEAEAFILRESHRNSSEHEPYQSYYDAELRDLVAERERDLIQTYGYRFDEPLRPV